VFSNLPRIQRLTSMQRHNGAWASTSRTSNLIRYKSLSRYCRRLSQKSTRWRTDFEGFLGVLDSLLPIAGVDEGVDAYSVPTRLYDQSLQDWQLCCHGCCRLLHILDRLQQHLCVRSSPSLLDARTCAVYQPVRDVVVSAHASRWPTAADIPTARMPQSIYLRTSRSSSCPCP
jgi:hypothetical protein